MTSIKQTAGRDFLGDFAPNFAHFNDDVLFGENWNDTTIPLKTRAIITVVALMAQGITDSAMVHHLENAKKEGVSQKEIAAIITHTAFYAGWPKAWAVFNLAKKIWHVEEAEDKASDKEAYQATLFFPIGEKNTAFADYFSGQSYLEPIAEEAFPVFNVTFEPGCRNHWHTHKAKSGGGQLLICVGGEGYYQEWGKPALKLLPGDTVTVPANTKHWHGASKDQWFSHLAFEIPGEATATTWQEPVSEEDYLKAQE
ncbi:carboxymuconolactone decarboxylase family protein [Streptococcus oralis]|uniref:4-carboxymuconolactone decarboxylase n=1 Tax=Streptococcus oralis TaxID=1303 RepID=A0A139PHA2_STROR|nr:carboxymuconolactone decarboxylase family protein [Streptococcus oralis]KXT88378.1 4-carboxymuconolactone decarboxylase [Streptococcus oralis]